MTNTPQRQPDPTRPSKPQRPKVLTLIAWIILLWTVLGWLRFYNAISQRHLIQAILPQGLFLWIIIAGLLWGLSGPPLLWGLTFRANWSLKLLRAAALIYPALYWFERLLLWKDPYAQRNWPFMLLLTIFWLGLVALAHRSTRVRIFLNLTESKD